MTIKERIELATKRLGKARAEEILRKAERNLPAGHFLTLAQRANHLETAMEGQGITAVWTSGSRAQPKTDEKSYEDWMKEFDAISDPIARTEFYRANISEMKRARTRFYHPNAFVLAPRRRRLHK